MAMKSTSMSTRFINGKKVTTKKVVDNGVETVTTYENDVIIEKFEVDLKVAIFLRGYNRKVDKIQKVYK